MLDVSLKVPLRLLALGGLGQADHPHLPRVPLLGDGADGSALAGRVAALEEHDHPPARVAQPVREVVELEL